MQVKSKGAFLTAWIDIFTMKFAHVPEAAIDSAVSLLRSRSLESDGITDLMKMSGPPRQSPLLQNQFSSQFQQQGQASFSGSFVSGRRASLISQGNPKVFASFRTRRSSLAFGPISGSFAQRSLDPVYEKRRASTAGFIVSSENAALRRVSSV